MKKEEDKAGFYEERINKLKLVHYISVQMNRPHSMKSLLELILEKCLELTGAHTGSVMLINSNDGVLDIIAQKGLTGKVISEVRLKLGEGITGWVAQTGNPKLVNNTKQEPIYVSVKDNLLSELAVPIKTNERIIGVISVDSGKINAFDENDLELMTMVSELAAQILAKEEMREKLESKVKSQDVLIDSFKIIESSDDLKVVFDGIMELLAGRMGIVRGMLALFDGDDPKSLRITAGYKISGEAMKKGIYKIGEGVIGSSVLKGGTMVVDDILNNPLFLNKMGIKRGGSDKVSFIASPIKAGKRALGVLAVEIKGGEDGVSEDSSRTLTLLTSMLAYRVRSYQRRQEETQKLLGENIELMKELKKDFSFKNIVGKSDGIRRVIEQVKTVSNTPAPVLITGETGTGKEMIAKILHFLSDRRDEKFISVNCAAIPENLLESELFGYEKGAFTGAASYKKGRFELADNGTLFLDEIGEMPLHLQSKILRALQEKEIEPLGSEKSVKVDCRIITATNRDLKKLSSENKFRQDLFFRLNVINIEIPPLRSRRDDIPLLVEYFLKKYNALYGRRIASIDSGVEGFFDSYNWPGNIRELENVMERAVIMSKGGIIDMSLIPDDIKAGGSQGKQEFGIKEFIKSEAESASENSVYENVIGGMEKILIEEILVRANYNKTLAAKILGINRNTLKAKIRQHNLS
ncbi:MAG TPA: GAF domain-containing protein [bacterium]|nr:GAF domain-containing protein [bacterium]